MKKLLIALAVAVIGIAANAAAYSWTTGGRIYDGSGNSGADYYAKGQTAYLMFASTITQSDLVAAFQANAASAQSTVTSRCITSAIVSDEGKISKTGISYDTMSAQTAYYVIFANDKMYVSGTTNANYDSLNPTFEQSVDFAAETSLSRVTLQASDGYSTAGWYAASPEPASGLLLLLGMAGLALKRKRA